MRVSARIQFPRPSRFANGHIANESGWDICRNEVTVVFNNKSE
jgi:hypothetical protein